MKNAKKTLIRQSGWRPLEVLRVKREDTKVNIKHTEESSVASYFEQAKEPLDCMKGMGFLDQCNCQLLGLSSTEIVHKTRLSSFTCSSIVVLLIHSRTAVATLM
jgi:hypothetical protein